MTFKYKAGIKESDLRLGNGPNDHWCHDDYYVYLGDPRNGGKRLGRYFIDDSRGQVHGTGFQNFWPPVVNQLARIERIYHARCQKDRKYYARINRVLERIWTECPHGSLVEATKPHWSNYRVCHALATHSKESDYQYWLFGIHTRGADGAFSFTFDWVKGEVSNPIRPDLGAELYRLDFLNRPTATFKVRNLLKLALLEEVKKCPKPPVGSNRDYILIVNEREYWLRGQWLHEPRPAEYYEGYVEYTITSMWECPAYKHHVGAQ